MSRPVCAVVGVGPGNGAAFARRFAREGHAVALMARNAEYLEGLAAQIEGAHAVPYDASVPEDAETTFARIREQMGPVQTLVYNAGSGMFGNLEQVELADFEAAWRINALGLLAVTRALLPDLRAAENPNVVVIGATASLRGGANFAAFASAKAAQRNLTQSMARHLGPEGIHVSYVIIDGVIDMPRTREFFPDRDEDSWLQPDDIAESVYFLTQQKRSAWTFELDLRPFTETW